MIYIYRRAGSDGANQLAEDLRGLGLQVTRTRGRALQDLHRGDHLVSWGDFYPTVPRGVHVLNNVEPLGKFSEAQRLAQAGVATVQVSRIPQRVQGVRGEYELRAGRVNEARLRQIIRDAQAWLDAPLPEAEWLARRNNHIGGADLLHAPAQPDYYSKKENIAEEYRLHIFNGRSIRAGVKRQRAERPRGGAAHPWIRSFDAGWVITYNGFASTAAMRQLAVSAIKALGLDFGAVDLARKADNTLIVLEVNRAPGIEGGTSVAYANKIRDWVNGVNNG